jgi:arsenic resistance protein ArsH
MKALIFNGALERRPSSTSGVLSGYIAKKLEQTGVESKVFNLADSGIPLFDITLTKTPNGVELMKNLFLEADVHIWLAPLYHGSIPGVMKNCLDWLEITSKNTKPYLTDKTVGMVCWADGAQAMQGINTMDAIVKSLRAWPLPFCVPISRNELFTGPDEISSIYKNKLDLLVSIASTKVISTVPHLQ